MTDDTTGLAPDEKVCPFCAETIKAAAIRCRFCGSDLPPSPEVEAIPEVEPVETEAAPRPPVVEPAEPVEPVEPEPAARLDLQGAGRLLVVGLLVLCLALGGLLWFLVDRSRNPDLGVAPNGQVTDGSFRNAAMAAASEAATKALSYSHATFEEDRKQARALMGGTLAEEYDSAMDQVAEQTASAKLTLEATVLSAGLLSAKEHSARVLLFVNTVTTREGAKRQQLDQNRVLMQLTRKYGDWIVTKMDAF